MDIKSLSIPDVLLIKPKVFADGHGCFVETSRQSVLDEIGIPNLVQYNHSRSNFRMLRGLHYQRRNPQGKLVRCARGHIFDVAVDLRRSSKTFGQWCGAHLDDQEHHLLWIPPGFAHGFLVLSQISDVCYACTNYYDEPSDLGIIWNDPKLKIQWPLEKGEQPVLTIKDQNYPRFKTIDPDYFFS